MFNSKQIFLMLSAMLVSGVAIATTNQTTSTTTNTASTNTASTNTATTAANGAAADTTATRAANAINAIKANADHQAVPVMTKSAAPMAVDNKNANAQAPVRLADTAITDKVKAELLANKNIHNISVSVATDKGVVTLSGLVANQTEKDEVVKITSQIEGVKSVIDQMGIGTI